MHQRHLKEAQVQKWKSSFGSIISLELEHIEIGFCTVFTPGALQYVANKMPETSRLVLVGWVIHG